MMHVVDLCGINIACYKQGDLFTEIAQYLRDDDDRILVGFYASLLRKADKDHEYRANLLAADIVYPDGQAVAWYCNSVANRPVTDRSATTDIWPSLIRLAIAAGRPVVLIGGTSEAVNGARHLIEKIGAKVPFCHHGYWSPAEEAKLVQEVRTHRNALVLVGLGAGGQERFVTHMIATIPGSGQTIFTVGGLFDHMTGASSRAPHWVQSLGMEWFWRVLQEPRRLAGRYLVGNSYFIYRTITFRASQLMSRAVR
jgi:N-acetylglucosaminyldiphosphoundecaprenol N-acetyl-beta-D-mannosaminyltransferase